jgi:manganese/zinc/iron transport system permease protein
MTDLFADYTFRTVAMGAAVLGAVGGALGTFAVLRRQGLMGDALSHSALPGVCLAYAWAGSKSPPVLMLGAAVAGWIAMGLALVAVRRARVDMGSALATVLTTFFGLGIVLLTVLQKRPDAGQAGLDKFLFGQAAALVTEHVAWMAGIGGLAVLTVAVLFKEMKAVTFDPLHSEASGLPVGVLGTLLTALLVCAVVIGLNTVGVVLMSAMLVAPAVAARQWSASLAGMAWGAAVIGAASGVCGAVWSSLEPRAPTGPCIVLCLGVVVAVSVLFGWRRGLVTRALVRRRAAG